ncbi:MAG: virulence RhuM family protein [Anaeroplasmataceae bacterium]|nr:virulence RhuM family protein [Anaeroplasmataceae bacterium]MDE6415030.1 virulence RhuM family protein [Anaeroplasmataceae bacterium]
MEDKNFEILKFVEDDFSLDVRVDVSHDTVWLTQNQMADLFDVDRSRVVRHIKNIFAEDELQEKSTCAENAQVQSEGDRQVKRTIKLYNLDMVISVGYRVKSSRGIAFRRWANKVLKEHLLQGYSVNQKRIEVFK